MASNYNSTTLLTGERALIGNPSPFFTKLRIGVYLSKLKSRMAPVSGKRQYSAGFPLVALLALAVVSFSMLTPGLAWGFSLGKVRVTGALSKQFKAEIPVEAGGQEGLVVMLGSEADYRKLGLKRPDFLDGLQAQVANHPTSPGDKIIYVTSHDPIYQPSFNLVVKAYMNGGHIVENYFLALDFQKNLTMEVASTKEEEKGDLSAAARDIQDTKGKERSRPRTGDDASIKSVKQEEVDEARREDDIRAALKGNLPVAEPLAYSKEKKDKRLLDEIRASEEDLSKKPENKQEPEPVRESRKEPLALKTAPAEPVHEKPAKEPEPAPVKAKPVEIVIKGEDSKPDVAEVKKVQPGSRFKMYKIATGDSLYAVSRKMAVDGLDMDRLVVAVWKENKGRFIKGNLHGIRTGTSLDYQKAAETARAMSREEARKIIKDQWAEWKKIRVAFVSPAATVLAGKKTAQPAPAPKKHEEPAKAKAPPTTPAPAVKPESKPTPPPAPAVKPESKPTPPPAPAPVQAKAKAPSHYGAALKAVSEWKVSQGPSFEGEQIDILSIGDVSDKGLLDVKVAKKGANGPEEITIQFKKETSGFKPLTTMKSVPAPSRPASAEKGRPFTAHVGAFREKGGAEEMSRILRKKGYNAYVIAPSGKEDAVFRVAVDRFGSMEEAKTFSETLRKSGLIKYGWTLNLPYSLRLAGPMSAKDAQAKTAELVSKGVYAYMAPAGDDKAVVLTGAYETEKTAKEAAEQAALKALSPSVVQP
jgi:cell division septation protein DedD